jgi:hypothetical protein
MRKPTTFVLLSVLTVASACSGKNPNAITVSDDPKAQEEADKIFSTRCTPCHGPTGGGDGPASAGLNPRPRNFHDKAWQSSVTDEHLKKIVQYGGAAVGKSAGMPANPDLQDKPGVVSALALKVRNFGRQ